MKTSSHGIERKDKILGDPKTCKRWLVWFRSCIGINYTPTVKECCGSNSWYPLDGRLSIKTITENIKSSNAYKYRPKGAEFYRIWKGSILNGEYITEIKRID